MKLIVNCKAYENGTGKYALMMAKICEQVQKEQVSIAIALQPSDIFRVASQVNIPVLSQHVDSIKPGPFTGWVLPKNIKESGAVGSLVNHSEHSLKNKKIVSTVDLLHHINMISIVCARSPEVVKFIVKQQPDIIAIEPPRLIGGKRSVSEAKPEIITNALKFTKRIPLFCGAGIHSKADVEKALKLGAKGILVSSGVVNARDPKKALTELAKGFHSST